MPLVTTRLRLAVIAACLLAVAACTGTGTTAGGLVSFAPAVRKAAPNLQGTTIMNGKPFSLAAELGHVVVVNYWASWCDPCRDEVQALGDVYTQFHPQGVTIIGVDFHGDGSTDAAAKAFLAGHKVPYDSLFDPKSETVLQFRGKVTIAAPPVTLVIDKQGKIAAVIDGAVVYSQLRDTIQRELAAA